MQGSITLRSPVPTDARRLFFNTDHNGVAGFPHARIMAAVM